MAKRKKKQSSPQADNTPAASGQAQAQKLQLVAAAHSVCLNDSFIFDIRSPALARGAEPARLQHHDAGVFIAATALVCAVAFLNHGTSRREITPEMLDSDLSPRRKRAHMRGAEPAQGVGKTTDVPVSTAAFNAASRYILSLLGGHTAKNLLGIHGRMM